MTEGKTYLTRDALLARAPDGVREIEIQGGTLRLRMLTGAELDEIMTWRDGFERDRKNPPASEQAARMLALAAVDENGHQLFTRDDVPQLLRLGAGTLGGVMRALNAMLQGAVDGLEERAKN